MTDWRKHVTSNSCQEKPCRTMTFYLRSHFLALLFYAFQWILLFQWKIFCCGFSRIYPPTHAPHLFLNEVALAVVSHFLGCVELLVEYLTFYQVGLIKLQENCLHKKSPKKLLKYLNSPMQSAVISNWSGFSWYPSILSVALDEKHALFTLRFL